MYTKMHIEDEYNKMLADLNFIKMSTYNIKEILNKKI